MNTKHLKTGLLTLCCASLITACSSTNNTTTTTTEQKTTSTSTPTPNNSTVTPTISTPPQVVPSEHLNSKMPPKKEVPSPVKSTQKPASGTALAALAVLPVKGRAPDTGYSRDKFPHWKDIDGDGCEADDQAVKTYATVELKNKCREASASMIDPYSGKEIRWIGKRTKIVDIDHVVALKNAWVTGAQFISLENRQSLANDPLNLLPVNASLNRQKSDSDAASWLPPNKKFRCQYVARQIAVKKKYQLWVTAPEKSMMENVLSSCKNEILPVSAVPLNITKSTNPDTIVTKKKPVKPKSKTSSKPAPSSKGNYPKYSSCKEAKSNGYGPYRKDSDPEYSYYNDRDGDGVVCEK